MNVLILGSGGREHVLYETIKQSPLVGRTHVAPGNGGIPLEDQVRIDINAFSEVLQTIEKLDIGLVVVGPEKPLVDGLGDYLREMAPSVHFFGPCKGAAQLEGSKAYTKRLCTKYGIPTADYKITNDMDHAISIFMSWGVPIVIKADGLCAGKGVVIANNLEQANDAAYRMLIAKKLGKAGETIVIERKLEGVECSVMAVCDGTIALELELAQDYKRLYDGADGPDNPNTGGMGAYSPMQVGPVNRGIISKQIIEPLLKALREEGFPYKGVLYAGIMLTKEGPMLLEVNCRFGDPETQVVLPRLQSDLVPYLIAAAEGKLNSLPPLLWSSEHAVCVTMVSGGYPGKYITGMSIKGLGDISVRKEDGEYIFHAGTKLVEKDKWVTSGGRVLNVVGLGADRENAAETAYDIVDFITWDDEYHRNDIGD